MASRRRTLILSDLRGGLNEHDPPTAIPRAQTVLHENIETFEGGVGRKRVAVAPMESSPHDGTVRALFRHVPDYDWNAELWAVAESPDGHPLIPVFQRVTPAESRWGEIVPLDTLRGDLSTINAVSFRSKLFIAAQTDVDRLHVWDASAAAVRRVGLTAPTTPPEAYDSDGAETGETRTYRVTLLFRGADGTIDRRSEPSPASAVVPMFDGGVTITQPTGMGTEYTHWELWAASNTSSYADYRKLGELAYGETYFTDENTPLTGEVLPDIGWNTPPPSVKFLAVDDGRLIMGCSRTNANLGARIWFTPPVGSSDIGDDERVPQTSELRNYVDIDPPSGSLTGLAAADVLYAFKSTSVYKLTRTGLASTPYRVTPVSREVGAINHKTIVVAEDGMGQSAVYFLSRRGPYRVSALGLEYLGTDIERLWQTLDLDTFGHGLYYHTKHQVWWWLPRYDDDPVLLVYDTRVGQRGLGGVRGGWSLHTGVAADCRCSVMFSKKALYPPWTPMSHLVPYAAVGDTVVRFDGATPAYADQHYEAGASALTVTPYVSRLQTGALPLGEFGVKSRVVGTALVCSPQADTSFRLRVRASKDFDLGGTDYIVNLPASNRQRVMAAAKEPLSGGGPAGCEVVQCELSDDGGTRPWQVDALIVHYTMEEET
jgi:hypothetical protein